MQWTVLVPMKALPTAKARLLAATGDEASHALLVRAIRQDTLAAITASDGVITLLPVVDHATVVTLPSFVQSAPGLNEGLAEAAEWATTRWPANGVAVLVGDLPALRPQELTAALRAAGSHARAFVPDAQGTGTTLLTARRGEPLRPAYGPGSAARHGVDAVELSAGPGLRTDVDTPEDLRAALDLGVGSATAAAAQRFGSTRSARACIIDR